MFRRCVLFFALPPSPSEITKALGTLGVTMDTVADEKMLKKVYRELVKKHHPDTGGDAEKIKSINLAHDLLLGLSPHERRAYLENKRNNQNPFERMSTSYAHTGQRRPTPDTGPGGAFYSADAAYDWRAMYPQTPSTTSNSNNKTTNASVSRTVFLFRTITPNAVIGPRLLTVQGFVPQPALALLNDKANPLLRELPCLQPVLSAYEGFAPSDVNQRLTREKFLAAHQACLGDLAGTGLGGPAHRTYSHQLALASKFWSVLLSSEKSTQEAVHETACHYNGVVRRDEVLYECVRRTLESSRDATELDISITETLLRVERHLWGERRFHASALNKTFIHGMTFPEAFPGSTHLDRLKLPVIAKHGNFLAQHRENSAANGHNHFYFFDLVCNREPTPALCSVLPPEKLVPYEVCRVMKPQVPPTRWEVFRELLLKYWCYCVFFWITLLLVGFRFFMMFPCEFILLMSLLQFKVG